jgi:hypothetical protein
MLNVAAEMVEVARDALVAGEPVATPVARLAQHF